MSTTEKDVMEYHSIMSGAFNRPIYENVLSAWQTFLIDLPEKHFSDVVMNCTEIFQSFPDVPQMKAEILRRMKHEEPTPRPQPERYAEPDLPADHRFSKLAEKWKRESITLGLDPDNQTPQEIFKERMREFWRVWYGADPA